MARTPYVPKRPALDPCPVEEVVAMIGGKWKSRLLDLLTAGPQRLSVLRRALPPGVSNEVLITQLQGLAADGLVEIAVERRGRTTSRRYSLTPLGWSVIPVLEAVGAWGIERIRARGCEWTRPALSAIGATASSADVPTGGTHPFESGEGDR